MKNIIKKVSQKFLKRASNFGVASMMMSFIFLQAAVVFADAPSPLPPLTASVVTNVNGTVTLTVQGNWSWPTHTSDCNTNRFAAGWAVDWNDANQAGNVVGTINNIQIDVGAASATSLNPADNQVYYPASTPRCGVFSAADGYNSGTWGPLSHTYAANTTAFEVCSVMYDMHDHNGALKTGDDIAGGQGFNDDNSVTGNGATPQGNKCTPFSIPSVATSVSAASVEVGTAISDTATLANGSANPAISGTLTFNAYGPDDTNCSNAPVFTTTKTVNGNGSYSSAAFTPAATGLYRWIASYGGDGNNSTATGKCNDTGEQTNVTPPTGSITIIKNANPTGSQSFAFTATGTGLSAFNLANNPPAPNSKTFSNLAAGSYSVTEGNTSGWSLTGINCNDNSGTSVVVSTLNISLAHSQNLTCTFSNTELGSIGGLKFEANYGGSTVGTLSGWNIKLMQGYTLIGSQLTGANGSFNFANLVPGNYSLFEELQNGWTQIFGPSALSLNAGQTSSGNNFGNFKNATVSGSKFSDLNGDGNWGQGEPALANWGIDIFNKGDGASLTTLFRHITTDANGNYAFTNLPPDNYRVCEDGQAGWVQTAPASSDRCYLITVALSGHDYSGNNFGNQGRGTITVIKHVINDNSGNKLANDFTMNVTGTSVSSPSFAGNANGTIVTLAAGSYSVGEGDHTGYTTSSSVDCSGSISIGQTKTCTITNDDIPHPGIHIVKSSSATYAHPGDKVTYTFTVTNTGDTTLSGVTVADDVAGNAAYKSGDTNSNGLLDKTNNILGTSETWIFTADYIIPGDYDSDTLTNTAEACGYDPIQADVTEEARATCDTDQHTLTVIHPMISIIKDGPVYGYEGQTIGYTYTVTNTGDTTLYDVNVTDNLIPNVDTCDDTTLAPDQSTECFASYLIPTPTTNTITNTGTAHGTDILQKEVTDTDQHTVIVIHPAIKIVKSGPTQAKPGDTVTYTFTVTNIGDVPLSGVTVADDIAGAGVYQSGDSNTNNLLDLNETWVFTKDYVVPANQTADVLNTATACAYDPLQTVNNDQEFNIESLIIVRKPVCSTGNHNLKVVQPPVLVNTGGSLTIFELIVPIFLMGTALVVRRQTQQTSNK